MARLEVEIGAEIKELQGKVNQASKDLKNFSNKASKDLSNLDKSSNMAAKGMNTLNKSTANGASALTSFSRTIQDAPFGIMGVSNNITNLTEQFGYLKARTGSAQGALKAMLKELKGFGGIALGISVATSLLLVFGDKIFATKDKVKSLREEQDKLKESLDNYVFGLNAVNQANIKGEQNAVKELTSLKLLSAQLNNTNLSLNERKGAIEELRKKYPDYLKNMSDEKLLNGGLKTVYDELTTSILKRAKATASMNAIIKNSEDLLVLESQLASEKSKLTKLEEDYQKAIKTTTANAVSGVNTTTQRTKIAVEQQKKLLNSLEGQIQNLELTNINLETNVTSTGGIAKSFIPDNTSNEVRQRVISVFDTLKSQYVSGVQEFNEIATQTPTNVLGSTLTQFDMQALAMKAKILQLSEDVRAIAENNLRGAFASIGQAIGSSLAGAGNLAENLGKALLGAMGSVLTQLGTMAITIGISLKAIKTALKSLNPVAAIGAGVALIALGGYFSSKSASIGNNIGGSNAQAGGGNTGSSGGGFTGGFSAPSSGGRVVFEIAGRKLVGVLKNEFRAQGNAGTTLSFN